MMLYGTEFKDPKYRADFKMKGKYRIVPLNLGEYNGKKIFDYEEVCIKNKDMSFTDYLDMRELSLIVESIYNNQTFEVFCRYGLTLGISRTDFIFKILENIKKAPKKIRKIFNEFKKESQDELWDSDKDLIKHYNKDVNYKKLLKGEAGGNLIYKYKSMNLATAMPEWINYLSSLLKEEAALKENHKSRKEEIHMLAEYQKHRTWKFLESSSSDNNVKMESNYDILAWLKDIKPKPLNLFKLENPIQYFFAHTELQQRERYDQFRRYGTSISALSKIVTRIRVENWLRSVGTDPEFIQNKNNEGRSRTRYAMST